MGRAPLRNGPQSEEEKRRFNHGLLPSWDAALAAKNCIFVCDLWWLWHDFSLPHSSPVAESRASVIPSRYSGALLVVAHTLILSKGAI